MRICAILGALPEAMLTVSVVPVNVTCCSWLLEGHWAAVQLLFAASMKCPMPGLFGLTVNSCVPLAPSLKMKLGHRPPPHWVPDALPVANPMLYLPAWGTVMVRVPPPEAVYTLPIPAKRGSTPALSLVAALQFWLHCQVTDWPFELVRVCWVVPSFTQLSKTA